MELRMTNYEVRMEESASGIGESALGNCVNKFLVKLKRCDL